MHALTTETMRKDSRPLLKVALTGGIATGKTYVLERLRALGVPVIDADRFAHRALEPGTAGAGAVVARFGPSIIRPDGTIDRRKLAGLVFDDAKGRRDLEAIVHPEVYRAIDAWFRERAAEGGSDFGVADVPLLYETGHESSFDRVIATVCNPECQLKRIMSRDGLTDTDARKRLSAQWPAAEKARRADFVIHTDGSMEDTDQQVDALARELRRNGD